MRACPVVSSPQVSWVDRRMSSERPLPWQHLAEQLNIDPDEVRLVHERYAAQCQFAAERGGGSLPITQWFRFYHLEKASEGQQTGAAPTGCSVDSGAVNNACIRRPGEFLQVLQAYDVAAADG